MRGWLVLTLLGLARAFCPPGCTCSKDTAPTVHCDGASLKTFPLFLNPRTRSINLKNNELSQITAEELEFYQELEFLDLGFNRIFQLDKAPFYRLGKLRVLSLRGNRLHTLHIDSFRGLEALAILDLSGNSVSRLPTSVFVDLRRLELLNLSNNAIADISPGALTGLSGLLELHLSSNELNILPKVALHAPTNLRILNLDDNLLSEIPADGFEHLGRLESLDMSRNQLDQVAERGFAGLPSLLDLDLSGNAFTSIPTLSFRALPDLRRFRFGRNLIRDLPTSCFEGLAGLVELSVEECSELSNVDLNAFSGLASLQTLRLNSNLNLLRIHPMAFEKPNALREVHIGDCGLSSLPETLLNWGDLELLDLAGNPWDCRCEGLWLGKVLSTMPIRSAPALCASPRHLQTRFSKDWLQGESLVSLSDRTEGCGTVGGLRPEVVLTMAVVGGVLFLVTVVAVTLVTCRHRIQSALCPAQYYANSDCLSSDYDLSKDSKKSLLYAFSVGSGNYVARPAYVGANTTYNGSVAGVKSFTGTGTGYVGRGSLPPPPLRGGTLPPPPLGGTLPPPPPLQQSQDFYATIDGRTPQFRVIRNYPVPITEL